MTSTFLPALSGLPHLFLELLGLLLLLSVLLLLLW